jgi:CHAT domain-containing protein/uncharacterized protein HemY
MFKFFYFFVCTLVFLTYRSSAQSVNLSKVTADSMFELGAYELSYEYYLKAESFELDATKKTFYVIKQINCLIRLNEFDKAQQLIDEVYITITENDLDNKILLLQTQALFLYQVGQLEQAEWLIKKSIETIQSQSLVNITQLSESYKILGVIYWIAGKDELAMDFLNIALQYRLGDPLAQHNDLAALYNNLGLVYLDVSTEKSIDYYNQALELYKKDTLKNNPNLAITYTNIGQAFFKSKNYIQASINYNLALDIWNVIYDKEHPSKAFLYSSLSQVNIARKNYDLAIQQANIALEIYQKYFGYKHSNTAATYTLLGSIYFEQKKYNEALRYFQKSLQSNHSTFSYEDIKFNPEVTNYFDGELLLSTLMQKALTLQRREEEYTLRQKDLTQALSIYFSCDTLINQLRQTRVSKKDKIALGVLSNEIYDYGIQVCKILSETTLNKSKYVNWAFYFFERSKAAVLQEAIADANAKNFSGIPKESLQLELDFKNQITLLEQRLLNGIKDKTEQEKINTQLFDLKRKYESHIAMLEKQYPNYYNLKYNISPITIPQLQLLLDNQTVVLEYFESESTQKIFVISISHKEATLHVIPMQSFYYKYIAGLNNAIKYDIKSTFIKTSSALYKQLIPTLPDKCKQLIVVPDGKMNTIPFECLLSGKVKSDTLSYNKFPYLINKYAIRYNYAATLLKTSKKYQVQNEVLLFAPVEFDVNSGMKNLPGTYTEVKNIDSILSGKYNTTLLLYEKATKAVLMSDQIKEYSLIQLSTHGEVNLFEPELSCIFTHKDTSVESSRLYTSDIYNMKLNAHLVVLSACQTGLGKVSKGEGMIGLSRALLYAGAENMMVSLWKVSDESTQKYMTLFYNYLVNTPANNLAKDVQQAKIKMIQSGNISPYYWSAFILIGK